MKEGLGLKCLKCEGDLLEGSIFLTGSGSLNWAEEEPYSWRHRDKGEALLRFNRVFWRDKENWHCNGYKCGKCGLIIFEP